MWGSCRQEDFHIRELAALERQNKRERNYFAQQKEVLHDNYETERKEMEEEMQDIIDEKQHIIDELQAELKAMKETCKCKAEVGKAPVSKRTRSQQS